MTYDDAMPPTRFGPANEIYLVPYELRDSRVIQFLGLQMMGYPVELETVPASVAANSRYFQSGDTYTRRDLRLPRWARPRVTEPAFEQYIEDPDVLGDIFNPGNKELFPEGVDELTDRRLTQHAAELNADIAEGRINSLAAELRFTREGHDYRCRWYRDMAAGPLGLSEEQLVQSALLTGAQRRAQLEAEDYYRPDDPSRPAPATLELVAEARRAGVRPLSLEAQIGLVLDYYQLVESLVPAFAAFKNRPQ